MADTPATTRSADTPALSTPLHALHVELGARMVPFAGYEMPVQFRDGILKEHLHTRTEAGLFDVSHMGQVELVGPDVDTALEALVPADIVGLAIGATRYTQFTNDRGGILDDLMVSRAEDRLLLVVNAACKEADIAHLATALPRGIEVRPLKDRALLALQGPAAAAVIARHGPPTLATMPFMSFAECAVGGIACRIWRSGYTGEDGYEISCADHQADTLARMLLAAPEVRPVGLGARDSLRLEAGLCLYGHDIDETTTPVEAGLTWSIGKRRRIGGGFPGAAIIQRQLGEGVTRRRVGIRPEGRAPAREHTRLTDDQDVEIGEITSGGFGPTVGGPVAMGYVETRCAAPDTPVKALVRGNALAARVVRLPFVKPRYYRG